MFEEGKRVREQDKHEKIHRILEQMAFGMPYEYDFRALFGENDWHSTSYYYMVMYQVLAEMLDGKLIKSRETDKIEFPGSGYGDEPIYMIKMEIEGARIKNLPGGWLQYQRSLRKKPFIDSDYVKYVLLITTIIGVIGWQPFTNWIASGYRLLFPVQSESEIRLPSEVPLDSVKNQTTPSITDSVKMN